MRRLLSLLLLFPLPLFSDTASARKDYDRLQKWQFSAPVTIPAGGLHLQRDVAEWTLDSGELRTMEPTSDGRVTGFVFEGKGRFRMAVPDPVELRQLRRFTRKADLTSIDQPITQLVFRTSEDLRPLLETGAAGFTPNKLAEKAHEHWLKDFRVDADARVIAATLNPAATYTRAEMRTADFDALTFTYDSERQEEITLDRFNQGFAESWIALDRAADRSSAGRPSTTPSTSIRLEHIVIRGDLMRGGSGAALGLTEERPTAGKFDDLLTIRAVKPVQAIRLNIDPEAHDLTVSSSSGELVHFRDHIGGRFADIDNKESDSVITVVLDRPLAAGEARDVRVEYELEVPNFGFGDSWYPTTDTSLNDRYTARLEFTFPKRNRLYSMGKRESEREDGNTKTSVWVVDRKTPMLTFVMAQRFEEETVTAEGSPRVDLFGPTTLSSGHRLLRNVGADVVNSLRFFGWLLDDPLKVDAYSITAIPAGHGQSFDGFLHMSQHSFTSESAGASELFRAHEVAHQWFGHEIGWATYRDQWLSESFAEYTAMMFVQSTLKNGDKLFREILSVDDSVLKGSMNNLFSKFSRPWLVETNAAYRDRLGPIALGGRAGTREIPTGYQIQTYYRGTMVLHMLRSALHNATGKDDLFLRVLREYTKEFRGKDASTVDFERVVTRVTNADWSWFFDQWINRSEIPTINVQYELADKPDGTHIIATLRQSGTEQPYVLPLAARLQFADGTSAVTTFLLKDAQQTFDRKLAQRPTSVTFNDDYSLLAYIRK